MAMILWQQTEKELMVRNMNSTWNVEHDMGSDVVSTRRLAAHWCSPRTSSRVSLLAAYLYALALGSASLPTHCPLSCALRCSLHVCPHSIHTVHGVVGWRRMLQHFTGVIQVKEFQCPKVADDHVSLVIPLSCVLCCSVYPYSIHYVFFDQYEFIGNVALMNSLYAGIAIIVLCLVCCRAGLLFVRHI